MVLNRSFRALLGAGTVLFVAGCAQLQTGITLRRDMNDTQLMLTAAGSCDVALGAILRSSAEIAAATVALCKAYSAASGGDALGQLPGPPP